MKTAIETQLGTFIANLPRSVRGAAELNLHRISSFTSNTEKLRAVIVDSSMSRDVRAAAIWALRIAGDHDLRKLAPKLLQDAAAADSVTWEFAKSVVTLRSPGGGRVAATLVSRSNASLREIGAWMLAFVPVRSRRTLLERALTNDRAPSVRAQAADSLATLGDDRAVGSLSVALGDRSPRVRCSAAWALGELGSQTDVALLSAHRSDRGRFGRVSVADEVRRAIRRIQARFPETTGAT